MFAKLLEELEEVGIELVFVIFVIPVAVVVIEGVLSINIGRFLPSGRTLQILVFLLVILGRLRANNKK